VVGGGEPVAGEGDAGPEARLAAEAGIPVPPRPGPVRRVLRVLFPLLGLALLAAVLWKVPWSDRVFLADGRVLAGHAALLPGGSVSVESREEGAVATVVAKADLAVREGGLPSVEEGLVGVAGRLRWEVVVLALGLQGCLQLLAMIRWWLLLRAQGISIRFRETASLSFLGAFLNQVVPGGMVTGDFLKCLYAAKGTGRTVAAVVSVFVDRVMGLFGTVLLAGATLAGKLGDPRFHKPALLVYALLAAKTAGTVLVFSRGLRAWLRVDAWIARVPFAGAFLAEGDRAVLLYREKGGVVAASLALSLGVHAGWCVVNAIVGHGLGIDLPLSAYFAVIPAILVVSALPGLPGGWGIGEASYAVFLGLVGVPPAEAVALSMLGRILHVAWALPGGFVFLSRRVV
jgi:uncharacterized protein (TIRG00374 family)